MSVDRCICKRVTFKHLLELSKHLGCDVDRLREVTGAGDGCGMCVPYIHASLASGKARVPLLSQAAAERILAEAQAAKAGQRSPDTASSA